MEVSYDHQVHSILIVLHYNNIFVNDKGQVPVSELVPVLVLFQNSIKETMHPCLLLL